MKFLRAPLLGLLCASSGCAGLQGQGSRPDILIRPADLLAHSASRPRPGVTIEGQPQVIRGAMGPAVAFDGRGDRIVLAQDLLTGADEFTIEVVLRPRDVYPASPEPRFLHIEAASKPERRLTMELRLTQDHQWYLDAFIKSESDRVTLVDAGQTHAVGDWYHVAVTYKDGSFATYVNGRRELAASVHYEPIPGDARASIGARLNRVHWFAGDIATIRVTPAALAPPAFQGVPGSPERARGARRASL